MLRCCIALSTLEPQRDLCCYGDDRLTGAALPSLSPAAGAALPPRLDALQEETRKTFSFGLCAEWKHIWSPTAGFRTSFFLFTLTSVEEKAEGEH